MSERVFRQQDKTMTQLASAPATTNQPAWLDELRRAAAGRFHADGFPSATSAPAVVEEWRYTNTSAIAKTQYSAGASSPAAEDVARGFTFGKDVAAELVFVNGVYCPALSRVVKLPVGAAVCTLAEALRKDAGRVEKYLARHADIESNPFVAMNTANLSDGAFVFVPRGVTVEGVIHLLFVGHSGGATVAAQPRTLIVVEENAEVALVESYCGDRDASGVYFTNAVTEIIAGADSRIDHNKLQMESLAAQHIATMQVELGRSARFVSHSTTIGAKLTRNDLNVTLAGRHADATLNGLVILQGHQHCDNHTLLNHQQPDCPSHELYKHVLDDSSSAVFKGKIFVAQPAQKTDSKQTSKTLLLSDNASMNSMPALEIYADDVKCTHGSTTGPVDEDMVFYLRSRGVGVETARHLLTYAFAADVSRRIKIEPVRARIESFMAASHGLPQDLRITHLTDHDDAVAN